MDVGEGDLLLLHGLGGTVYDWSGVRPPTRLRVHIPPVAFHGGRAEATVSPAMTFDALCDDVLARFDSDRRNPMRRFALGGISMGAAIALTIAARLPDQVSALVLVAPSWLDQPFPANLKRMVKIGRIVERYGLPDAWAVLQALPPFDRWHERERAEAAEHFLRHDPAAVSHVLQRLPGVLPRIVEPSPELRARSVVLTWTNDPIHPVDIAERLGQRLGGVPVQVMRRPTSRRQEMQVLSGLIHAVSPPDTPPSTLEAAS
jgi:pimeloyl-ACP methyl ester carboxylesterase